MTINRLASVCRVPAERLLECAADSDLLFKPQQVKLVNGKVRKIDAPTPLGRRVLTGLHKFLQVATPPHKIVHGGALRRSCFTSARQHVGKRAILTADIYACYPSVTREVVYHALEEAGFMPDVADLLASLLVVRGALPQGSPASGDALNIVLRPVDQRLEAYAQAHGMSVTRTYDDIVVSADRPQFLDEARELIEGGLSQLGLEISRRKFRRRGRQRSDSSRRRPPLVHSLVVSKKRGVAISRVQADRALDAAQRYREGCRCATPDSLRPLAKLRERAVGHFHYTNQADVGPARNVRQLIEAGDRALVKTLKREGVQLTARPWHYAHGGINEIARIANTWSSVKGESGLSKPPRS